MKANKTLGIRMKAN